jgi:hypothetical protein
MIRPVKFPVPRWHAQFLSMLPQIKTSAAIAFRGLDPEAREEAIQEVIANAVVAYARLVQLKKVGLAYPTVLARYAVAQIKAGRKVGTKLNVRDVSSEYAQRQKGFSLERLDQFDRNEEAWIEVFVEDRNSGPAVVATTKIDFTEWLRFRRAFATVMAPRLKPEALQKLMRHKSYSTTLRYVNTVNQLQSAIEIMPFPPGLHKPGQQDGIAEESGAGESSQK